jgi:NAD(P)-dependent dehydrogenase (short-subunit alcohol dehydrogenase family)
MTTVDGKVILLTGATDGMGRQLRTLSDRLTAR